MGSASELIEYLHIHPEDLDRPDYVRSRLTTHPRPGKGPKLTTMFHYGCPRIHDVPRLFSREGYECVSLLSAIQ